MRYNAISSRAAIHDPPRRADEVSVRHAPASHERTHEFFDNHIRHPTIHERRFVMHTDTPIIRSFLDLDFYKLTMGQFIWKNHRGVNATYALANRHAGRVPIADLVDIGQLTEELAHARKTVLAAAEKKYLLSLGAFEKEYVDFLAQVTLPEVAVERVGNQYAITVTGPWETAVYWETIILAVVNELIGKAYAKNSLDACLDHGRVLLDKKIAYLSRKPDLTFVEFGTRRRFSFAWQREVITRLAAAMPRQLAGTSNVHLAMSIGIAPVGTFAHEMTMAYAALAPHAGDAEIRASHGKFLDAWQRMYGERFAIALSDTWGAEFFFSTITPAQASAWRGLRHDSGDPFAWGERFLAFYKMHGIDPKRKIMLFSDGLDANLMLRLYERFSPHAVVSFGWGTNLTNDVGFPATSIVVKITEVGGTPTVKLSDNLAKAMGPKTMVERYARIFNHRDAQWKDCAY